jgi:hypothetical protein
VLIHLKTSSILFVRSRQSPASNFLAARIGAFDASLCYAKITPATLHRGEFRGHGSEAAEAAGGNPKFRLSKFAHRDAVGALPAVSAPRMAAS